MMTRNLGALRGSIRQSFLEIENDDGPRGSEGERNAKKRNQEDQTDHVMDRTGDDARGTKRKPEDEGEREETKRQDNMIVSSSREEELTRRDTHEALRTRGRYYIRNVEQSEDKNANRAMDVPSEEDCEQELAEAWDDIDGQELDPEAVKKAPALQMECHRKMNVYEKRSIE